MRLQSWAELHRLSAPHWILLSSPKPHPQTHAKIELCFTHPNHHLPLAAEQEVHCMLFSESSDLASTCIHNHDWFVPLKRPLTHQQSLPYAWCPIWSWHRVLYLVWGCVHLKKVFNSHCCLGSICLTFDTTDTWHLPFLNCRLSFSQYGNFSLIKQSQQTLFALHRQTPSWKFVFWVPWRRELFIYGVMLNLTGNSCCHINWQQDFPDLSIWWTAAYYVYLLYSYKAVYSMLWGTLIDDCCSSNCWKAEGKSSHFESFHVYIYLVPLCTLDVSEVLTIILKLTEVPNTQMIAQGMVLSSVLSVLIQLPPLKCHKIMYVNANRFWTLLPSMCLIAFQHLL